MHAFRSKSDVLRFALSAWLLIALWCVAPTAIILLFTACFTVEYDWMLRSLFATSAAGIVCLTWLWLAHRARCPLCIARPLFPNSCSLHRRAPVWLGSYRLPVAASVVFRGRFRCPFCGETTAMRARPAKFRNGTARGRRRPGGARK